MLHNTRPAAHRGPCPPVIARETKEAIGEALWQESVPTRRKVSGRSPRGPSGRGPVVRLGLPGVLWRTLATSNPSESALSVTRRVTARVTRWRDGDMRRRWCVAGLLRAESQFRRVKGHRAMTTLLKALEGSARAGPTGTGRGVV